MDDSAVDRADRALEEALQQRELADPRQPLRALLKELKDTPAFDEAVRYYREELVPKVADGEADPLDGWLEFGRKLAALSGPGREVVIDPGGKSHVPSGRSADNHVILYLPDDPRQQILPLRLPRERSRAQEATLRLLVERKTS